MAFKPCGKVCLLLCVLAWLRVFLLPELGPGGGVAFKADVDLGDPESFVPAKLPEPFEHLRYTASALLLHASKGPDFSYTEFLGHVA